MTINVFGGGNTGGPAFPVQRSVRLRSSASAYFNRTPASASNRQIFTLSGWVKRGGFGILALFSANTGNESIRFNSNDALEILIGNVIVLVTTQVFRDPSSWYHIVVAFDTTQATTANRIKIYVNGSQVTSFSTSTYVTQNTNTGFNTATLHWIGQENNTKYFDGYITEVNFIDGQALTPIAFGGYNPGTGVWEPRKYSGTYGTNGFYLPFTNPASIGADGSGNGNNWTANAIQTSNSALATYDSMLDVPTNTGSNNANFATLNPLAKLFGSPTSADGNLRTTAINAVNSATILFPPSGKWYLEGTVSGLSNAVAIGICNTSPSRTIEISYQNNGNKNSGGTTSAYGSTYTTNDVIGMAVDCDLQTVTFYKNNTSQGALAFSISNLSVNDIVAEFYMQAGSDAWIANFGQRPFTYTPPSGFKSLNTYNLPAPTIPNGATQFAATTYSGSNSTQSISNAVNGKSFQPDFVWIKKRSGATDHNLTDSIRGTNKNLISNSTAAEDTTARLTSFDSSGFTLAGNYDNTSLSGSTYVGWQWKASNAAPVTNTSGSITSSVSANPSAGFSIVTYTGTGANATVGHGLGVAPKMVIVKNRTGAANSNWCVWHTALAGTEYLFLQSTAAKATLATMWNSTTPTSSVLSLGTYVDTNFSTGTFVAYCFSEIAGYSKFGSYTGNGATDGVFVYTGFRPRFVMVKRTDTTGDWVMLDSSRSTYNAADARLWADLALAEVSNTGGNTDFLSNGFKLRNVSGDDNASSGTYIYAAFAESPFNYSLAR